MIFCELAGHRKTRGKQKARGLQTPGGGREKLWKDQPISCMSRQASGMVTMEQTVVTRMPPMA